MSDMETREITKLIGQVPIGIYVDKVGEEITFLFEGDKYLKFYHEQDCCENVFVEDVNGNWYDLLDTPIVVAEERTSYEEEDWESTTWTFYTFRTIKGSIDVRWCGTSNGYYSEAVNIETNL